MFMQFTAKKCATHNYILRFLSNWIQFLLSLLRGVREGSIISDAMHGRVVMAMSCKTFQCSKYLFVLKQVMSALVDDSNMELYFNTE